MQRRSFILGPDFQPEVGTEQRDCELAWCRGSQFLEDVSANFTMRDVRDKK